MAVLPKANARKLICDFANGFRTKRDMDAYIIGIIAGAIGTGKTPTETLKTVRNILEVYDEATKERELN
ncbi:hypothetical protein ABEW34_21450 [Paenibacillus algorifonticola]|uniref:hypothetical protein n=1 Tax=Paenibacillus algorifonticola TaxID=684063 RepID=UPI003D2C0397